MANRLAKALEQDNNAEDRGMHGDDRATCHQCQSWKDHAHHPTTNARITDQEYAGIRKRRGF